MLTPQAKEQILQKKLADSATAQYVNEIDHLIATAAMQVCMKELNTLRCGPPAAVPPDGDKKDGSKEAK